METPLLTMERRERSTERSHGTSLPDGSLAPKCFRIAACGFVNCRDRFAEHRVYIVYIYECPRDMRREIQIAPMRG